MPAPFDELPDRLNRGLTGLIKDTETATASMTPEQIEEYIHVNSSWPIRLRTVAEVYATHPDERLRALSDLAFRKLAAQYDTEITSGGYDL